MNIVLDLIFVVPLKMGIAGAALATIIAQFVSAILIMMLLIRTEDVYRFTLQDICLTREFWDRSLPSDFPMGSSP